MTVQENSSNHKMGFENTSCSSTHFVFFNSELCGIIEENCNICNQNFAISSKKIVTFATNVYKNPLPLSVKILVFSKEKKDICTM